MDKEDVAHVYNGILLSHEKNPVLPVDSPAGIKQPMRPPVRSDPAQTAPSSACGNARS